MLKKGHSNQLLPVSIIRQLLLFILIGSAFCSHSQSFRHWTRNFNDESSLLAGAVVGGGIGPSAIYFNPAGISEARNSSLSINTSLLSFKFYNISNALGEGHDLYNGHIQVQPRFISYLISPKRNPKFSVELTFLNNETYTQDYNTASNQYLDILTQLPGQERYFASFQHYNSFRDDWFGLGSSWKLSPSFFLGASLFVISKSLDYRYDLDIKAYPLSDTIQSGNEQIPFYSASYLEKEYFHLNNYRLMGKIGVMYKQERISAGLVIRTPSVNVFADGKRMHHYQSMSNITDPDGENFLPNYEIRDYKEKKDVEVNFKDPVSIAAGLTIYSKDGKKALFTTVEYFAGNKPYSLIQSDVTLPEISGGIIDIPARENWMTFTHGARPVLNAAIGYRLQLGENFMMMGGFRTDFNYRTKMDFVNDPNLNVQKGLDMDVYHITYGIRATILGQNVMAGLQYSFGRTSNQRQYINLADPVEYNVIENAPLQGERQNTMVEMINSISLYFGATFNFGTGKDSE
jgi:hypothetical protein